VLEGPTQAPPEAKPPHAKILSVLLRREDGQNGRINGIRCRYVVPSISISVSIQCYTVYMVQYTVYSSILLDAHTYIPHTLYYPTVHDDHEHTPGAVYTHRTEQTSKLRLAAGERRHL